MSKQDELVPEVGGGDSDGSGDAESPRQLTDQGDDSSITGASTASHVDDAAVEFNEPEMEEREFQRGYDGGKIGEAVSGCSLEERGISSVGRECPPLDDGSSTRGDFAKGSCRYRRVRS